MFRVRRPFCRLPAGLAVRNVRLFSVSKTLPRQRLIILGTGWGSYSVLKHIDKKLFDVIVVSPRNHFLFTPLLCSTTVGTLEFRSIIEPIRNTSFRDEHHFQLAQATTLYPEERMMVCKSTLNDEEVELCYDKLVIGVGTVSNTFGVPGVYEHAFFLKEIADARRIRNQILINFELAMQPGIDEAEKKRLLHFVIVGGGHKLKFGAELYDFIRQDVARLYAHEKENIQVTFIEAHNVLPSFDKKQREFAEKKMKQHEQFKLLQSCITEVHKDGVTLEDGTTMPCSMLLWSAGLAPREFTASLDLPKNKSQQLLVDDFLQVKGQQDSSIFALGDCSFVESNPYPCTAQVAEKQGLYLAKSLALHTTGRESEVQAFSWNNSGGYQGLADFPTGKLQGFKL